MTSTIFSLSGKSTQSGTSAAEPEHELLQLAGATIGRGPGVKICTAQISCVYVRSGRAHKPGHTRCVQSPYAASDSNTIINGVDLCCCMILATENRREY